MPRRNWPRDCGDRRGGRSAGRATALWASVAETVRQIILPALDDDPHTRQVAIHLVGLATYAGRRGPDPIADRVDEIADLLDAAARRGPAGDRAMDRGAPRTPADVLAAAGAVLSAAGKPTPRTTTRTGSGTSCAVLVRQLDADLATEDVLLKVPCGGCPDG